MALLGIDAGDLGVNAFHLGADALALLGESGIGTADLVARRFQLTVQYLDLVVDVVELLARHGAVLDELGIALALTLGIGNLLLDGGELLVQVQLLAAGCRAVGRQLALAGC